MTTRCVQIFEEYIQSEITRKQYMYNLKRFATHNNLESVDAILSIDSEQLKQQIEDYVILFKNNGNSSSYIRVIIFSIQSFCEANDKLGINWKKIRRLLGKKQKSKKSRPYTTTEIKRMINSIKSLRGKSVILFLSSSGVRRGALPVLKMNDLKQMPNGCLAVTVYANSEEEYITFINKEANDALTLYFEQRKHRGEVLTSDSPVFLNKSKSAMTELSISSLIQRAKNNAGVNFDNSSNLLCHAFRRRFNTILKLGKDANGPLIERMLGHDMKLDNSYFQPTEDQLFAEYCKGMADLTIDDSERLLAERKSIEVEKIKLDSEIQQNRDLEIRMKQYESNQNEMMRLMNMVKEGYATIEKTDSDEITLKLTKNSIQN